MALLLDLDNTLFSSVPAYDYAIGKIAENWQKKKRGTAAEFLEMYEKYRKKTKIVLAGHTSNRLRLICFKQLIEEKFGMLIPKLGLELDKQYYKYFRQEVEREQKKKKKEFKRLFKLLKFIASHDRIVLVTNETLRTQLLKLSFFFPEDIPFKIVTSEEIGVEKPGTPMFQRALELAETEPAACVMIGDSLKDDIGGALNHGISGIHLTAMFGDNRSLAECSLEGKKYLETDNVMTALEFYCREYLKLDPAS